MTYLGTLGTSLDSLKLGALARVGMTGEKEGPMCRVGPSVFRMAIFKERGICTR